MKKILIYGDSNSWGYIPTLGTRYPREIRWPGVAAEVLGDDYELIEDSISGRTTIYDDPIVPQRNGLKGLGYALDESHPMDMVILFVGSNDLKFTDAEGYRQGITTLIRFVKEASTRLKLEHSIFTGREKILVVGPPLINPEISTYRPQHSLANAAEESKKLSGVAKEVADSENTEFIDISTLVYPDPPDCLHLSPECHRVMGMAIAEKIKQMLA